MIYTVGGARQQHWPKRVIRLAVISAVVLLAATAGVHYLYNRNLGPASASKQAQTVTVEEGATVDQIGRLLEGKKLIRSAWAFKLYVKSKDVHGVLQAGTYEIAPSQSVAEIVSLLTHGKIVTNLVTILPGQRLDQIRNRLIQDGFTPADVDAALDPAKYTGHTALADKPVAASLEGYLYPDSYQKTAKTSASAIVEASLQQMDKYLTPDLRSAFAAHGLTTHQAIILASIIEKEVAKQSDRDQVAQVFLRRLSIGMNLQSDVTVKYGQALDKATGQTSNQALFDTYEHAGLPPSPISNVTTSTLRSVANPANTDWLYFIAGDDGNTHFAHTLEQHQANIVQYCQKLCPH